MTRDFLGFPRSYAFSGVLGPLFVLGDYKIKSKIVDTALMR